MTKNTYVFWFLALYLVISSFILLSSDPAPESHGEVNFSFGSADYIEYWSAWRVLRKSHLIYDPSAMQSEQNSLFDSSTSKNPRSEPLMMWNPPWLLYVMGPVLILPFALSVKAWIVFSVLLLAASARLLQLSIPKHHIGFLPILISMLLFHPVWFSLEYGQQGCLLTFGCALLIYGLTKHCYLTQALALFILSTKPHLFVLLFILVPIWNYQTLMAKENRAETTFGRSAVPFNAFKLFKAFGPYFVSLLLIAVLTVPTEFLRTGTTASWLAHLLQLGENSPNKWFSAAFFSALQSECIKEFPATTNSSYPLCNLLGALRLTIPVILAYALIRIGLSRTSSIFLRSFYSLNTIIFVLVLSITFSPFSWHFDSAPLCLAQGYAMVIELKRKAHSQTNRVKTCFGVLFSFLPFLLLSAISYELEKSVIKYHHLFFFFPITFAVIFILCTRYRFRQINCQNG